MDPDFRDKAWQEMQSILDREMPVQKDKRRFIIWFWRAAGVLLLITAGIIFLPRFNSQHDVATEDSAQILNDNHTNEKIVNIEKNSNTITESLITQDQPQLTKSDKSPKSRNQYSDVIPVKLSEKETVVAQNPIPNDFSAPAPKEEVNAPIIASLPKDDLITSTLQPRMELINAIRTLDFQVSGYSSEPFSFEENSVKVSRRDKPRKIDFLVYANGQSESLLALTGYEAGLAVNKRLGESKWGISFGAGFQSEIRMLDFKTESYLNLATEDASLPDFQISVNPEASSNFGFSNNTDAPVNNPSVSDYEYLAAANAAASKLNVKLNYLAFPVSASYRLTPRIGILAGVTPSVYLSGSVTVQDNYAEFDRNFTADEFSPLAGGGNNFTNNSSGESHPLQNNRYFYYTSKPLAPAAIKRVKFPVHAGLNYQISRHLGLTLDYQYTIHNITDKPYIQTPKQRLRLGGYLKF